MHPSYNLTLVTGTTEVLITASQARLVKIIPQATSVGTITIREATAIGSGATARFVAPIGTTPANPIDFSAFGVKSCGGLTVQLSSVSDTVGIVWGSLP